MSRSARTTQQVCADKADLALVRMEGPLADVKMRPIDDMKAASLIRAARNIVRGYMHPANRMETAG